MCRLMHRFRVRLIRVCMLYVVVYGWSVPYVAVAHVVDDKAQSILNQIYHRYQVLKNFKAEYRVMLEDPDLNQVRKYKLLMVISGPRYKLCYDRKEVVTDGRTVWIYDDNFREVTIKDYKTDDALLDITQLYTICNRDYASQYLKAYIAHKKKGVRCDVIKLSARCIDNPIDNIILEIERGSLKICRWRIVYRNHAVCQGKLSGFATNLALGEGYFQFNVSDNKHLEVVDIRENTDRQ